MISFNSILEKYQALANQLSLSQLSLQEKYYELHDKISKPQQSMNMFNTDRNMMNQILSNIEITEQLLDNLQKVVTKHVDATNELCGVRTSKVELPNKFLFITM